MQNIINQIPDAFTDSRKITESHIPTEGQHDKTNKSKVHLKRGRPIGSKDKIP